MRHGRVARRAKVGPRTLFRHFPTKEALLYADMDDLQLELRRAFSDRPLDQPVLAAVREAMLSLAEDFERQRDLRLLQARLAARYSSVSAHFRAVIQTSWEREIIVAVAERLGVDPMSDPRPEIIAGAAMSAIRVATRQWTASGGELDFIELCRRALGEIERLGDPSLVS